MGLSFLRQRPAPRNSSSTSVPSSHLPTVASSSAATAAPSTAVSSTSEPSLPSASSSTSSSSSSSRWRIHLHLPGGGPKRSSLDLSSRTTPPFRRCSCRRLLVVGTAAAALSAGALLLAWIRSRGTVARVVFGAVATLKLSTTTPLSTGIPPLRLSPSEGHRRQRGRGRKGPGGSASIATATTETKPTVVASSTSSTSSSSSSRHRVLTAFVEPTSTMSYETMPLPVRTTDASKLGKLEFPRLHDCSYAATTTAGTTRVIRPPPLPIDEYPDKDPYLPWLHDYFVHNGHVHFVAQNKRRCQTGDGKDGVMRYWEPQIALFQPIAIQTIVDDHNASSLSSGSSPLSSSSSEPFYRLVAPEEADYPETKFFCRFDDNGGSGAASNSTTSTTPVLTTLSEYSFNYEYVAWRKRNRPMFQHSGRDVEQFEFSQLLFSCPIPSQFLPLLQERQQEQRPSSSNHEPPLWLELVPIRTPARTQFLLTHDQAGPEGFDALNRLDAQKAYGDSHILPAPQDSGRWSNLPICPQSEEKKKKEDGTLKHNLVVCTWTASSYRRRGDVVSVTDSPDRLMEWISFHRLVGVDHMYLYDNTSPEKPDSDELSSPLWKIAAQFPGFITYVPWPATSCSNNRPNHKNPGERSSQYAAEASCRERFGSQTEWMAFLDTDEYLIPLQNISWTPLLAHKREQGKHVLKLKSSRGKPRVDLMDPLRSPDGTAYANCTNPFHRRSNLPEGPCLGPRRNETYLKVYNCAYIKPPAPDRFARAMKQIYRPAFVLSHFVHYSTVTSDMVRYYKDWPEKERFTQKVQAEEWGDEFLDDLTEGLLIHTKSILPHETMTSSATCQLGSKHQCPIGYVCPETTLFVDEDHQKNVFRDASGHFCNCWVQEHVDQVLIPLLERNLYRLRASQ